MFSQIAAVSHSVRRYVADKTAIKAVSFIASPLQPPLEKAVLANLGIRLSLRAGSCGGSESRRSLIYGRLC